MIDPRRPWHQRALPSASLFALVILAGCTSVRPVQHGAMYRSGQLSAAQLDQTIDRYGIRTVVNLRGPDPDRRWYRDQQEICQKHGVRQVDIALHSSQPSREEVETLLSTYRGAERPMLIHSWSSQGSVGLASALYRVSVLGEGKDLARKELPVWTSRRWPIPSLSAPERFLDSFTGENAQYASREAGAGPPLPDPMFERSGSAVASQRGPWSPGDDRDLPPPSMEYFENPGNAPRASLPPANVIQPVVWLGTPVGLE